MTHRNNVHPDQDLHRVIGWNPLLDSQLPLVLRARFFGAFVDAEGALETQSETHWNKVVIGLTKNHKRDLCWENELGLCLDGAWAVLPCQMDIDVFGKFVHTTCFWVSARYFGGLVLASLCPCHGLLGEEHDG